MNWKTHELTTANLTIMNMITFEYINLDYLELMADGDEDMKQTMLEMLLEELPEELQKMRVHTDAKEWDDLSSVSHKMKSTLSFVGYSDMVEANKEIELLAKHEENPVRIEELMKKLESCFERVMPELKSVFKG